MYSSRYIIILVIFPCIPHVSSLEYPINQYEGFLALLDSVSRAHGMGLLSVVRRPSVLTSDTLCGFFAPSEALCNFSVCATSCTM